MTDCAECRDYGEFSGLCYFGFRAYLKEPRDTCENLRKDGKCPRGDVP
jgi:hypothetical protein